MTKKLSKAETEAVSTWTRALTRVEPDVLNRIIKATARDFDVNLRDPEDHADYQHALDSSKPAVKAEYVMGFGPIFGDEGIVAYLISNSHRWGLDVEPEKHARGSRAKTRDVAPVRRKARVPRGERTPRKTRTAESGGKRKTRGTRLNLVIPGDVFKTCDAMGLRKISAHVDGRSTLLKKTAKYRLTAAADGSQVLAEFTSDAVSSVVRFVRGRLNGHALERRVVISDAGGGEVELPERVVERCRLKRKSGTYRLIGA